MHFLCEIDPRFSDEVKKDPRLAAFRECAIPHGGRLYFVTSTSQHGTLAEMALLFGELGGVLGTGDCEFSVRCLKGEAKGLEIGA